MPYLVTKKNGPRTGVFEVCWTWLPYFLAANNELHKLVDQRLQEMFCGREWPTMDEDDQDKILAELSEAVIDIIVDLCPMQGLRGALVCIEGIQPGVEETRPQEPERPRLELVGKENDDDPVAAPALGDRQEDTPGPERRQSEGL